MLSFMKISRWMVRQIMRRGRPGVGAAVRDWIRQRFLSRQAGNHYFVRDVFS
jgi:hypothetical protein